MPEVIEFAIPGYPRLPSGGRETGEVRVEMTINSVGSVIPAKAISGPDRLRVSAKVAALKWRFAKQDQPVTREVVFALIQRGLGNPPQVAAANANKLQTDASRSAGTAAEYANSVYSIAGVAYTYTDPITQNQPNTVNPNRTSGLDSPPIPQGTALVGEAHSHTRVALDLAENPKPPREQLSFQDRNRSLSYPDYHRGFQAQYVALPNGTIIKYDVQGRTTVLRSGNR